MKGPGAFASIGRQAKDLLTRDFSYDQKFSITTTTASGITFNTSGTKKQDSFSNDVKTNFIYNGIKSEIKVDSKSTVSGSFTTDPLPGFKVTLSGNIPDQKSGKADLHYSHEHAYITTTLGLNQQPLLEGSIALGAEGVTVGGELTYDTASSSITKYTLGLGLVKSDYATALILADKADTVKGSYYHSVYPTTAVAVEVAHKISKNDTTFTAGGSYKLDPLTLSKFRLNNRGTISALIQHEWRPKSFITISGEVDTKALDKNAKVGVALQLKP